MAEIHADENLLLQGANVLTLNKNGHKYGMTFAWGMAVDYDKLIAMIGGQSITGHHLKVGDKVGISALANGQKEIALHFGDNHSDEFNKFDNDFYEEVDGVALIKNAARQLICEVVDIFFMKDNHEDPIVEFKVLKKIKHADRFINYIDLK